jgi:hypothetical protein
MAHCRGRRLALLEAGCAFAVALRWRTHHCDPRSAKVLRLPERERTGISKQLIVDLMVVYSCARRRTARLFHFLQKKGTVQ